MQRIVPESFRALYERTLFGKAGSRAAIKMFCAECVGYDRDEVINCTDLECPLYQYRPFSGIKRQSARKSQKAHRTSKTIVGTMFLPLNKGKLNKKDGFP